MLDWVIIANEVVDKTTRRKNECLVLKVYYEKAYDSVSWQFLFYMMGRFVFLVNGCGGGG